MAKATTKPPQLSAVDKEIKVRSNRIARMVEVQLVNQRRTDEDNKKIDKRIERERVLIDALKRGRLN
jgi:hypothetical protein